jgi:lysophospholipase L1-like esterase
MKKTNFVKQYIITLLIIVIIISPIYGQYRVFTIGDSTVQDYNEGYSPRKGWGQMLPFFFDLSRIDVINNAVGGTSSKSFYNFFWTDIKNQLQAGDYVFIQFGINDRASDEERSAPYEVFKDYIRLYVSEARAKGAIPVLVSTVRRNAWTADGLPYDAYHEHPVAMRELAIELSTPIVDLNQYCYDLFVEQGELYATRFLTMNLEPGEYLNYPSGAGDNVHYQQIGATDMARQVCEIIQNGGYAELEPLTDFLKPQFPVTITVNDPSKDQATIRSATYPEGIEVTLKTIPESGANFIDWLGNDGVISTNTLSTFVMGREAMSIHARYETTNDGDIEINNTNNTLMAPVASHYQWFFNNAEISGATSPILNIMNNGTYSVTLMDDNWNIIKTVTICVTIGEDGQIRRIFICGDSTVCNYRDSDFPMTGWGQVLGYFFNDNIEIYNHAIGGRSSRSFIEEGRWDAVKSDLASGDYVFVQFGHNDRDYSKPERYTPVDDYKEYIIQYVTEARALGAIPVLVSPMVMNAWNGTTMRNVFTEAGNDYRGAMAEVASEYNVAFVDLNMKSWNYFKQFDYEYCSRFFYNRYLPGEYSNYPDGINDGTHFQECGAITIARMIVEGITEQNDDFMCPLNTYLEPQYAVEVSANIANPGSITPTLTYPAGCPATVKVLPLAGSTFNYWALDGNNAASSTIYRFTMPEGGAGTSAIFNGGIISAPEVSITNPINNAVFAEGADITINATASSPDGTISNVAFYANEILIANDNNAPYSIVWNNVALGEYSIYAIVTDNFGVNVSSTSKTVSVSNDTDCAGVQNGQAYYDDCGICVGGTTGLEPCNGGGQAEDACSFDGTVDVNNPGFTGEGFVNFENNVGSTMQFNIQCISEGIHSFEIVYANGGTTSRPMSLTIGSEVLTVDFLQTTNWQTWESVTVTANFQQGVSQCELVAQNADGGPNIDKFLFSDTDLSFGSCTTDCEGVFGGTATLDECGICSGGHTGIEPCVQDCNGDWGGLAIVDDCGNCVNGNTGLSPCIAHEAEDISEYIGILESTNTGFSGTGYVNTDNVLDSYITFYLNAEQAVNVPIMVRYANGSTDNRDASVSINHTEVYANIEFLNTGGWTSWDTKEINLSLDQGVNIITFMSTTTNGLANIDKIWYYDPTVTIASAEDTVQNQDPQEIQLKAGWNLIGYPLITTQTLENALSGIWSQVEVVKDMSGFYLRNQDPALQSLTEMEWGKGYFLKVDADCTLIWQE